jgi:hypothetical protein
MLTISVFIIAVLSLDAASHRRGVDNRDLPTDRHRA